MRQIIFTEFDLIISNEVSDIFKWFGVNSLAGITFAEAKFMDQHNASMKISMILVEGSDINYDNIYNFGEAICLDVLDELNFPEVYHRV